MIEITFGFKDLDGKVLGVALAYDGEGVMTLGEREFSVRRELAELLMEVVQDDAWSFWTGTFYEELSSPRLEGLIDVRDVVPDEVSDVTMQFMVTDRVKYGFGGSSESYSTHNFRLRGGRLLYHFTEWHPSPVVDLGVPALQELELLRILEQVMALRQHLSVARLSHGGGLTTCPGWAKGKYA